MNSRAALSALLLLAAGSAASAQLDRRSRDEPEVILNHGGRYGFCDDMVWDASGRYLFAAGDDKEVTVWPVDLSDPNGPKLNTDRASVQHLRWPAWRERRGGIKAIAVDPTGDKVAVGGFGLLPSAVAVLSRTRTTAAESVVLAYTWPRARTGKNADNFDAVTAVAFDADGKRVAFGTADGSVWVWTAEKLAKPLPLAKKEAAEREWSTPRRAGKHALPAGAKAADCPARPRLVFFLDKDTVASVSNTGEAVAFDVSGELSDDPADPVPAAKKTLFHLNPKANPQREVYRAELTPDGKGVCVAFLGPTVGVYDLAGRGTDLDLGVDRMAWSLAVEPGSGRLAVAVGGAKPAADGKPRFFLERENELWVYDVVKAGAKPAVLPLGGRAEAVAFHPKRKGLVAVAGGQADEVRLFDLDGKDAKVPTGTAVGVGRRVFAVGIVSDTEVAVKVLPDAAAAHPNADARGPWITYDLSKQKTVVRAKEPSAARNEADGWTVLPDDGQNPQRQNWYAVSPDKKRARLAFNHAQYNDPTCYTFLPADKGKGLPTRLLVGHSYGCSLYELPAPGADVPAELKPAAVYIGHQATVLSVAASADGTWFVTGGSDHTVSAFSLRAWGHHRHLGAAFAATPGKAEVVVTDVAVGSPAWEAGLVKGEKLTRVAVYGRGYFLNTVREDDWPLIDTPAAAEQAAKVLAGDLTPGQQVHLETDGPEGDRVRLTSLQQRPVWKWFPAFAARPADPTAPPDEVSDSVVWMWKGSKYMSAAAQGDLLAGWHVNPAKVFGSPYYYPLLDRNKRYSDPDLIRQLLRTRDVPAALTAACGGKNPTPKALSFTLHEPVPLKLALPKLEVEKGKAAVKLTLDLAELTGDPDLLPNELEVWVNDYRKVKLPVQLAKGKPFAAEVELDVSELRAGDNSITAIARNRAGGRVRNAGLLTNTNPAPANPRLVGWAGGINKYPGANAKLPPTVREAFGDLNPLRFAVPDATAVSTRFKDNYGRGRLYREYGLNLRTDHEADKSSLVDELKGLVAKSKAGELGPDDTLVLFLAGHGVLIGDRKGGGTTMLPPGEKEPEKGYENIRFAFCGVDFDPLRPTATGVPAEELFDLLVQINCRKLVFLDVCHAGGAVETDIVRQLLPEGQGPFVFAACGWGELAQEDPADRHGLFTRALLDATGDEFYQADADKSGDLSCRELAEFCTRRVKQLRLKAMKAKNPDATRSDQNPEHNLETTVLSKVVVFRKPAK